MPRSTKSRVPESHESSKLARMLRQYNVLFCHVPNEARRSWKQAARLRGEGMTPGVPDFLIFESGDWGVGLAVEMKRASGGKLSGPQMRWLRELEHRGWATCVANGFDAAVEWFQEVGFWAALSAKLKNGYTHEVR